MLKLRTILTWTTALLFVALAGGCHGDPAAPVDWSSSLSGSWGGDLAGGVVETWGGLGPPGTAVWGCGRMEAVLSVAPGGEIAGTWGLSSSSCGSYAGTVQGSLVRDVVRLRFITSTGQNLFQEVARRVSCDPGSALAADEAIGNVFSDTGGSRHLTLDAPVALDFVAFTIGLGAFCVWGQGDFGWRAVPSQS